MHGCGKLLSLHVRWNAWSYTHTHAHVHVHMHIQECCWNPRKVCNWVKNYCVNTTFPVLTLHYHSTIITGGSCRTRNASMHTQGTSFANAGRPQTIKKKITDLHILHQYPAMGPREQLPHLRTEELTQALCILLTSGEKWDQLSHI